MSITKNNEIKQKLKEFVDAEGGIIGGDRNATNDSEIETGPVSKPFNDTSDYEKGVSTTTDRATRYRQNIPWFAVYSYRGTSTAGPIVGSAASIELSSDDSNDSDDEYNDFINNYSLNEKKKMTKKQIEEEIKEDLVKKSKNDREVWGKDYDVKTDKLIDTITDSDLTDNQLEKIKKAVLDKITKKNG